MKTNNGLEQYNCELGDIFGHSTPSLICFIKILEKESRAQAEDLEHIHKGLVINRKRKRQDYVIPGEFDKPCYHHVKFKENKEIVET